VSSIDTSMKYLIALAIWFTATMSFGDGPKIRVLALKHSKEQMAQGDEDLAFRSIQDAKSKGLDIEPIGGHWVDKDGVMRVKITNFNNDIPKFRDFVSKQMKVDAETDDTIVVFTIGHGSRSGYLDNLGQRSEVLKAIAEAADENDQKTLWWQLSCHATAGLPGLETLPQAQQELLTISASSSAERESPAGVEGKIMGSVFTAMAEKSSSIDPNKDDEITAEELKNFLATKGRGSLYFAISPKMVVFGGTDLANQIPIVDRNNPQGTYPKDYIPKPRKRGR